ncbi:AraC family transcriptional regulator [Paenibacillus sp. DXFW5]|uniref:AraC family transcriptional regulator n=1 Tax=Paenibacillus rhizolycopersici TaxID=2780073 RepID=A0ABS2H3A4_9BACL|nr:AraC family transcriptional regulator [Paenibacillus rhizolycopersici]MBM6995313.1 AraC family transcriptional regulator [Paenibacillus rhizolycopersici]
MIPEHDLFEVHMNPDDRERDVTVLFSGQGRPHPNHRIGPSVHDHYLLHTVFEGKGTYTWGGRVYSCGPGDTFVIFPNGLFTYEADSRHPWHYAWVALKGPSVHRQFMDVGITPDKPVVSFGDPEQLRELYARLRSSFRQSDHPYLEGLEAAGWMTLLFHHFGLANQDILPHTAVKEPAMIDRQVDQAIRWFQLQYPQQIGIEELSRNLGYHRAHLFNAFKARTGLSPKQYLTKVRIDKAKELLTGSLTVDQIASSVGFNDALYFSRQFKKSTGMSPSEYRSGIGKE